MAKRMFTTSEALEQLDLIFTTDSDVKDCSDDEEKVLQPGGLCASENITYVLEGMAWSWWCFSDVKRFSLEVMTFETKCKNVETLDGIQVAVTMLAECKVCCERDILQIFHRQLLGKSRDEMENAIREPLESHLRIAIGELNYNSIKQDTEVFSQLVEERAAPHVMRQGIEIVSLSVGDIKDTSLTRPQSVELQ